MKKPVYINQAIIKTLKDYHKKLPIDFLAKVIGRQADEIKDDLEGLKNKGVIEVDDQGVSIREE
jgi:predicted transcriptional regulator